jgi:hypothetical protein
VVAVVMVVVVGGRGGEWGVAGSCEA